MSNEVFRLFLSIILNILDDVFWIAFMSALSFAWSLILGEHREWLVKIHLSKACCKLTNKHKTKKNTEYKKHLFSVSFFV